MEDVIVQIAVQVPALALVVFFSLQITKLVLNEQGKKIERLTDVIEKLTIKLEK